MAIEYLFDDRSGWRAATAVGKTLVSSAMIDRVAAALGRRLVEVPVGFKWFVDGLLDGSLGFGGEESAGASFLRRDGTVWTTDKDGIIMDLLAAEMTAVTGADPGMHYAALTGRFGAPVYERSQAPANLAQKKVLSNLTADLVSAQTLAGEPIRARLTHAPGNGAAIGGLKVVAENGCFAARPSGTEDVYKIYAESFRAPRTWPPSRKRRRPSSAPRCRPPASHDARMMCARRKRPVPPRTSTPKGEAAARPQVTRADSAALFPKPKGEAAARPQVTRAGYAALFPKPKGEAAAAAAASPLILPAERGLTRRTQHACATRPHRARF